MVLFEAGLLIMCDDRGDLQPDSCNLIGRAVRNVRMGDVLIEVV